MILISLRKITLSVTLLYLCLQIFFPKISVAQIDLYPLETIELILILFLLTKSKLAFNTLIEKTYFAYMLINLASVLRASFSIGFFEISTLMILIKYSIYISMFSIARYLKDYVNDHKLNTIYFYHIIFFTVVGAYVLFNHIIYPQSIMYLSGSYTQQYRLIGFTGYSFGSDGLQIRGTTSVAMGVFAALLAHISLARLLARGGIKNFIVCAIFIIAILLTYSRTGLLAFTPGFLIFIFSNIKKKLVIYSLSSFLLSMIVISLWFDLWKLLNEFGAIGKVFTMISLEKAGTHSNTRIGMWIEGLNYLYDNPVALLFGIGYGEKIVGTLTGISFYESFFLQTIMEIGLFGLSFFLMHLLAIWMKLKDVKPVRYNCTHNEILYGFKLFFPGFIIANCFGANMFQTDFMAAFFYFMLAGSLFLHINNENP